MLGVDSENCTMVVRPGGAPYAGGRPRTVPSGLVRPEDLGIVIDASACRRQRSLLGESPGQLFGVELTDRVVDGGAIVRSTSRLVSSAITALGRPPGRLVVERPPRTRAGTRRARRPPGRSTPVPPPSRKSGTEPAAQRLGQPGALLGVEGHLARHPVRKEQHHRTRAPTQRDDFSSRGVERRRSGRCGTRVTPS